MQNKYAFILGYAQYLSEGLIRELLGEIAEKEKKGIREVLKEMGMSTGTPYKRMGEGAKRKVLEKALETLPTDDVVLRIFYDIRALYGRVIRDIIEVAGDDVRREVLQEYKDIGVEKIGHVGLKVVASNGKTTNT